MCSHKAAPSHTSLLFIATIRRLAQFQLLTKSPGYGATVEEKHAEEEEEDVDDDEEEDDDDYFDGTASFHLNKGCARELAANIWTSMRATPSFVSYGDEYELVPTLIKGNHVRKLSSFRRTRR